MALWRAPALEAVLGVSIDESTLDEGVIRGLVTAGVREGEQLDFKAKPYVGLDSQPSSSTAAKDWSREQEFAKDVCAFANHIGGLLVVGIKDEDDVAVEALPWTGDVGAVELRLRQALANYSAPQPRIHFIPIAAGGDGWFLVVVIPPSPNAPHAVKGAIGNTRRPLQYPVRDGSGTRWLLEHEIATRYRARASGRDARRVRRQEVVSQGLDALTRARDDDLWLYLAIAPEAPVEGQLDQRVLTAMKTWLGRYAFLSPLERMFPLHGTPIPAPDRVTISGSPAYREGEEDVDPREGYLELHVDGCAFIATPLQLNTSAAPDVVGERTLADDVVLLTHLTVGWAAHQAGAWGLADIEAGLVRRGDATGSFENPVTLHGLVDGYLRRLRDTRPIRGAIRSSLTVDLSLAPSVVGRVQIARNVLTVLLHHFGISEPRQFEPDGTVVPWAWGSGEEMVRAWAREHGMPVREADHSSWR